MPPRINSCARVPIRQETATNQRSILQLGEAILAQMGTEELACAPFSTDSSMSVTNGQTASPYLIRYGLFDSGLVVADSEAALPRGLADE